MSRVNEFRALMISWNNRFPLDAAFRKKHNIAFGSPEHRKISQIDIYFEWLEDKLHEEFFEKAKQTIKDEKQFEEGVWLKDRVEEDGAESWDLFSKLKVKNINESQQLVIDE